MATHLHCIEIVLIKPLICGHPPIMAEIFGPMVAITERFHCSTVFTVLLLDFLGLNLKLYRVQAHHHYLLVQVFSYIYHY